MIASGTLSINGKIIVQNEALRDEDEIRLNGEVIREGRVYKYYALHKPPGVESTFNQRIKDNLTTVFELDNSFFIAGRLDKASEGLLLVSNNGKWVNAIASPESRKEKEYEVEVDKILTEQFISEMGKGVDIGFYVTRPCIVRQTGSYLFKIVLTEGKNRQIRRMCKKLGYGIKRLKRVRIDEFYLSDMQELTMMPLNI